MLARRTAPLVIVGLVALALAATAGAGTPVKIKGTQTLVDEAKGKFEVQGSLVGKWNITAFNEHFAGSDGTYVASGKELFNGCFDANGDGSCAADEPKGTLKFTFIYWATFKPGTADLVRGACVHPIVGGTGGFANAKGIVHMVDKPTAGGVKTTYAGTLDLGAITTKARKTTRQTQGRVTGPTCGG